MNKYFIKMVHNQSIGLNYKIKNIHFLIFISNDFNNFLLFLFYTFPVVKKSFLSFNSII